MANVQISEELFFKILRYHSLYDIQEPHELDELHQEITKEIEKKLDALATRQLYSKYKDKTLTAEEREKARQEYLDKRGIRADFRW